jgi:hypothetical protein
VLVERLMPTAVRLAFAHVYKSSISGQSGGFFSFPRTQTTTRIGTGACGCACTPTSFRFFVRRAVQTHVVRRLDPLSAHGTKVDDERARQTQEDRAGKARVLATHQFFALLTCNKAQRLAGALCSARVVGLVWRHTRFALGKLAGGNAVTDPAGASHCSWW